MSTTPDQVLQLGRDLADALDPSDVVGRWMSHQLAAQILLCEENPTDKELLSSTQDLILRLWEHKSGAPFRTAPYSYVEPVLRAIERLDPNPAPWAYYRPFDEDTPSTKELTTYPLLRMACDVDHEIGNLIRILIGLAAGDAISSEESWVMAGKDTAKTEEDKAVRALEQLLRRLQYQPSEDVDEVEELDGDIPDPTDQDISVGDATDDSSDTRRKDTRRKVADAMKALDSADPLTRQLHSSLGRCRRLLDQLASICDNTSPAEGTQ